MSHESTQNTQNQQGDFRTRLVEEYSQLHDRYIKLRTFLHSDKFLDLNIDDRVDLMEQKYHMKAYLTVLRRRVNRLCDNG